ASANFSAERIRELGALCSGVEIVFVKTAFPVVILIHVGIFLQLVVTDVPVELGVHLRLLTNVTRAAGTAWGRGGEGGPLLGLCRHEGKQAVLDQRTADVAAHAVG